jgi:hypothetical protein
VKNTNASRQHLSITMLSTVGAVGNDTVGRGGGCQSSLHLSWTESAHRSRKRQDRNTAEVVAAVDEDRAAEDRG